MEELIVGNFTISKKGILKIAFLLFLIGVVIGGVIIAPSNGANWLIAINFIVLIVLVNYRTIKKEIQQNK